MVLTIGFVVYAVPPYLTLDPSRARLAPLPDNPVFYPLLVTHIFLGSIVLLTGCLQLWPWLRRAHRGCIAGRDGSTWRRCCRPPSR